MKQSIISKCVFLLLLIISLSLPMLVMAQDDPGPSPDDVPIDGGLTLLIAAGVGYGVKKIREERKKTRSPKENL